MISISTRTVMKSNTSPLYSQNLRLLKLMRLTSPSLPIGGYSYSQGLEFAVSSNWVHDRATASDWIEGLLRSSLVHLDLPILKRLYQSWQELDLEKVSYWNNFMSASRDSFELQEEDRQMGKALARLLVDLAAVKWDISLNDAASGFLWMWVENKVLCAVKLIPLGQTDGQKILSALIETIAEVTEKGLNLSDDDIGYTAIGHGIASALHETQYTRLFRS